MFLQEHELRTAPVRELDIHAHEGNRVTARIRLTRPAFMPPIALTLAIDEQPRLPDSPILVLRLASAGGLMAFAGPALRFLNVLPPGLQMDGDRIAVNLRTLLQERGLADALDLVEHLEVFVEEGRFVLDVRLRVP